MVQVWQLAGEQGMRKASAIGSVFVVIDKEKATEVCATVKAASLDVPDGRILFVIWKQSDSWAPSVPVESISVSTILGDPTDREESKWDFFGCGTARLYTKHGHRPTSTAMWVGFRSKGEKAYLRNKKDMLPAKTVLASTIPVSDKVFTRDVANNVWHMSDQGGLDQVVSRLQSLTTWSDEIALVYKDGKKRRKRHTTMVLTDALVPVVNKVEYSLDGFPFPQSGKQKSAFSGQLHLF
jgi:hypothetical protein